MKIINQVLKHLWLFALFITFLSAWATFKPTALHAQAPASEDGYLRFILTSNGRCLDLRNQNTRVQTWDCDGSRDQQHSRGQQQWYRDRGQIKNYIGLCLEAEGQTWQQNGGKVVATLCRDNAETQQWHFTTYGIVNRGGLCLDVHAPAMNTNGAKVQVWECNSTVQQSFRDGRSGLRCDYQNGWNCSGWRFDTSPWQETPKGSWRDSCVFKNAYVDQKDYFRAYCYLPDGSGRQTFIYRHGRCLTEPGNFEGRLVCAHGGFLPGSYQETCAEMRYDVSSTGSLLLTAQCRRIDGSWQPTVLEAPEACVSPIANDNGRLVCAK